MYKILRQKVASTVTNVESPEHFEWTKWLRAPETESISIEEIFSLVADTNKIEKLISPPSSESFEIKIKKPEQYDRSKKYIVPKPKSIKVFFKPAVPTNKSISLKNPDDGKIIFTSTVVKKSSDFYLNIKEKNSTLKSVKMSAQVKTFETGSFNKVLVRKIKNKISFDLPETVECLKTIETEIYKIDILTLKKNTESTAESKAEIKNVVMDLLAVPTIHKVKILEDNKIATYFLKNVKFAKAKTSKNYFSPIDKTEIIEQPIPYEDEINIEEVDTKLPEEDQSYNEEVISGKPLEEEIDIEELEFRINEKNYLREIESILNEEDILSDIEKEDEKIEDKTEDKTEATEISEPEQGKEKIFTNDETFNINYDEVEELLNDDQIINELSGSSSKKPDENKQEKKIFKNEDENIRKPAEKIKRAEEKIEKKNEESVDNIEFTPLDDVEINGKYLYEFQKDGIKNLIQNRFVLLANELGTGKTFQAVSALNILFEKDIIKSALIICDHNDVGSQEISNITNEPNGWLGHLDKIIKDKKTAVIKGEEKERASIWNELNSISIISYADFLSDLNEGTLKQKTLKNIDCLIFDEIQEAVKAKLLVKNFIKASKPKYIWYLSSIVSGLASKGVETLFNDSEKNKALQIKEITKDKAELTDQLPKTVRQDIWFELDSDQKTEYENTLNLGKERITKLLQAGNPFIIQSNVFTLLHQLKQICNFASSKKTSGKANYLLNQLETIIENKKKVLIFSQYDKLGTHRLEELLTERKIKFISYNSGMSLKEIDDAKKSFRKSKTVHVLINGIKTTRSTVNLAEVPYVIYFDQWWNPASVWKTEDFINNPEKDSLNIEENLNIYNYFVKDTIEEKIKEVLSRKGLLHRNITEMLPAETINEIVTTDEWLEVLGISESDPNAFENYSNKINDMQPKDLIQKIENIFARLGYRNTAIERSKNEGQYDLVGTKSQNGNKLKISGKCFTTNEYNEEELKAAIQKLASDKSSFKNFIIHFNEIPEEIISSAGNNIFFISKNLLTNYFIDFRLI